MGPRTVGLVQPATAPVAPWSAPHPAAWNLQRETPSAARRARAGGIRTAGAAPTAVVYPQATGVMSPWPQPWAESVSSIALPPPAAPYPLAPVTSLMVR